MKGICDALRRFYGGIAYPISVAAFVLLGHATGLDVPFGVLLLLSLVPALWLCTDLRFAVAPMICFLFLVSAKDYSPDDTGFEERFLRPEVLIPIILTALLVIVSLVAFCLKNAKSAEKLRSRPLLWGVVAFCGVLLFNGLFSEKYTFKNFVFAFLFAVTMLGVYLLFAAYLKIDRTTVDYVMFCFLLAGVVVAAELILAYFTTVQFVDGEIVKGSVVLGWGVWTTIGGMLAFLMPAAFYFAASKKHGWIAFLIGLFEFFCILLSQSRGALLVGAVSLVPCLLYLVLRGENRKYNRIWTAILAVGALGVVLLFSEKLLGLVQNFLEFGFADNGRFEIWQIGLGHFLNNPVLGSGFYDSYTTIEWERAFDPYLYHNTVVQLLGACGLLGFLAYGYHRFTTLRAIFRRPNACKIFLGVSLFSLLAFSLLDVLFFKLYPTLFYGVMLVLIENSEQA